MKDEDSRIRWINYILNLLSLSSLIRWSDFVFLLHSLGIHIIIFLAACDEDNWLENLPLIFIREGKNLITREKIFKKQRINGRTILYRQEQEKENGWSVRSIFMTLTSSQQPATSNVDEMNSIIFTEHKFSLFLFFLSRSPVFFRL